jgi:50S ribosomal subunit-associated GTPase HflX
LAGGERAIEVQRRVLRDRIRHVQKKLEGELNFQNFHM